MGSPPLISPLAQGYGSFSPLTKPRMKGADTTAVEKPADSELAPVVHVGQGIFVAQRHLDNPKLGAGFRLLGQGKGIEAQNFFQQELNVKGNPHYPEVMAGMALSMMLTGRHSSGLMINNAPVAQQFFEAAYQRGAKPCYKINAQVAKAEGDPKGPKGREVAKTILTWFDQVPLVKHKKVELTDDPNDQPYRELDLWMYRHERPSNYDLMIATHPQWSGTAVHTLSVVQAHAKAAGTADPDGMVEHNSGHAVTLFPELAPFAPGSGDPPEGTFVYIID